MVEIFFFFKFEALFFKNCDAGAICFETGKGANVFYF